jgi:hypothetical protein
MRSDGYAIVLDPSGKFVLKYYHDVNIEGNCYTVAMSYSYDEIMRELFWHREQQGMGKEYWIS